MSNPLEYAKRIAYSSEQTLMFTYEMAKKYADKPGCYVECGVAAGAQIIAMAAGANHKTIYAFDSFQGIPLPSNKDDQYPGIKMLSEDERKALPDPGKQKLESSGATSVSKEDFWANIESAFGFNPPDNIWTKPGWFEETVIGFKEDISILRLDGDLYNSTWVCLQHLFPKVLKGGCVIIDDIQLKGCADAVNEYFELIGYTPDYKYISNICYFIK